MKHDPVVSPWLERVGVASMEPREVRRVSLGTGTESGQRSLGALVGTWENFHWVYPLVVKQGWEIHDQ